MMQKPGALDQQLEYAAPLRNAVCVTFHSDVDSEKTTELINQHAIPVVDYLQFCASILSPPTWRHIIEFKGDFAQRWFRPYLLLAPDSFTLKNTATGPLTTFRLDRPGYETLQKLGVVRCAQLFGPGERNEYDDLIHLAITNFAEGERAVSPRQKLLSYVASLELFFNERSASTQAVVEGVAYVAGKNYEHRIQVMERIEKMYDARSRTTHSGVAPSEIDGDRTIVLDMILRMISLRDQFTSKADLKRWIEKQRFSTPGDTVKREES